MGQDDKSQQIDALPLFPVIEPYATGYLETADGHRIYYEECGRRDGTPVLIVHGGPGGGCSPLMRRYHDPSRYRIVLFDQRGCGRSKPHAALENNTTWHLIDDMELLRTTLGIENWQLFGGSWGSTLSLAYAISHPERVRNMILRGIFLMRQSEIDWFYRDGCNWLFPDAFATLVSVLSDDERSDIVSSFYKRLTGTDRAAQVEAAKAWSRWEATTLSLRSDPGRARAFTSESYAVAFARIESHYFVNLGFFGEPNYLLANVDRIRHIPARIVHGRFDVVTPVRNAWDLKQAWPEVDLNIVAGSGHAMSEPRIVSELVRATRAFA
ncbi:MAG: prolyl aminopeptidase [Pseudomonadota bacterium]